jgi:hypothetical protein
MEKKTLRCGGCLLSEFEQERPWNSCTSTVTSISLRNLLENAVFPHQIRFLMISPRNLPHLLLSFQSLISKLKSGRFQIFTPSGGFTPSGCKLQLQSEDSKH